MAVKFAKSQINLQRPNRTVDAAQSEKRLHHLFWRIDTVGTPTPSAPYGRTRFLREDASPCLYVPRHIRLPIGIELKERHKNQESGSGAENSFGSFGIVRRAQSFVKILKTTVIREVQLLAPLYAGERIKISSHPAFVFR